LGGGVYWGTLNYCTLSGNSSSIGGGACLSTLNNCSLISNSAMFGGGACDDPNIGGAYLNNCLLYGNSARYGGGVDGCTLNHCTVVGNSAGEWGGGTDLSSMTNCIVYGNTAPAYSNYNRNGGGGDSFSYCCMTPLATNGVGNIAYAPLFVNQFDGNLHLQANSPCINSGKNAYVVGSTDLDGNPRIVGGTVDIGAYEFQTPASTISYAWLQQYGLPTDGSADNADADGDGMNNWKEWITGTDPTDALSILQMLSPTGGVSGMTVSWQSVTNRIYSVERATDLGAQPAFSTLATNITGRPVTTTYTNTGAVGPGPYFYRVGTQP
jgi:hypothetical protein